MVDNKDELQALLESVDSDSIEFVGADQPQSEKMYYTDPILMDDNFLESFALTEEFQAGLMIGAKYAGVYTAMINAGAEVEFAQDITINVQMEDIAKSTGKINKEIADVTSKNSVLASEKSQL